MKKIRLYKIINQKYLFLLSLLFPLANICFWGISATAKNNTFEIAQSKIYNPIQIPENQPIEDKLTADDIPTGDGGFARDYYILLQKGEQIAIDVISDEFDSIVVLMSEDGTTIAENDDAPDSSTNSLLFTRIAKTGRYIIRVRAFGQTGNGNFKLKVTRLQPIPSPQKGLNK